MPRAIWKGSISFGLVHVPVSLHSAEQRNELHFSLLDRRDLSPVGYRRVNKRSGDEVSWDDIVRGYEYEKGEFVVMGDDDFKRANVEATQTIEIQDFVDAAQIPVTYYDKPYYLEPVRKGEKAYALLREILKRTGKVGIARVVLRSRQHLAALMPVGNLLVLELMRYYNELRAPTELKLPGEDLTALGVTDKELDMAGLLVEGMVEAWQPERYRDTYRDDVLRLVEEKVAAGKTAIVEPAPAAPARRGAEVIDLMSQLKRSVEQAKKERGGQKPRGRRRA